MSHNFTPIDYLVKKLSEPTTANTSFGKEVEPIIKKREAVGIAVEKSVLHETVEHEPAEEVRPFIQPRSETISLPPDLKKIGVQATSVPVFATKQQVVLPMSDDAVFHGLKAPISSSLRWLSEFCIFLLKHAHVTLKEINGKIQRVSAGGKK